MFILLHMYLDQHSDGRGRSSGATASYSPPVKKWKIGHVLATDNSDEEWSILKIESDDGIIHREDTSVTLKNIAGELRELKGASLYSRYKFKSPGDVAPEAPEERADVKEIGVSVAGIREFYPRKEGRDGSRVIMHDKTVYVVMEDFPTIWQRVQAASSSVTPVMSHLSSSLALAQQRERA
jgi:hypothetical protein